MPKINWTRFRKSLTHAGHGLRQAVTAENNFRIHILIAVVVIITCLILQLSTIELAVIFLLIGMILTLEMVNTIIERFADLLEPRIHPYVHIIKDMMAAAVLLAVVTAIVIAGLIILPALIRLL